MLQKNELVYFILIEAKHYDRHDSVCQREHHDANFIQIVREEAFDGCHVHRVLQVAEFRAASFLSLCVHQTPFYRHDSRQGAPEFLDHFFPHQCPPVENENDHALHRGKGGKEGASNDELRQRGQVSRLWHGVIHDQLKNVQG